MYLETFIILFAFFFAIFVIGQLLKDNSIVDIGWGAGFVFSSLYLIIRNPAPGAKSYLITALIILWGARLTYHIGKRNIGKPEDFRYVNMRKSWGDRYVLVKAFLNVYFLQMMVQYIVTLPVIYGHSTDQQLNLLNILGICLWGLGFFFEAYGDYQLKQFKRKPENKGKLMEQGLWSLTRHPNYFGDAAMWFGIFFIVLSDLGGIWTLVGPSLMAYLLVFVSGVRMLEKKYEGREDYEAYKKRTNAFIPWIPKGR